eukprot:snap_masked-scaffold_104-processed-gene-0.8-mRNA-1 protein AED:1.00 eAED:1.00 QI:0/0/0/0/1/1/2/0/279
MKRKRYCPSWSAGVKAIYGILVTYLGHPNALTDFLGCVMQWTKQGKYSRSTNECLHSENLERINNQKISEFNYVTHFLDHMFMKYHPSSILVFHINWYRFQYCDRGISFLIKLPTKDGELEDYSTTVQSDNQFVMKFLKLYSYSLAVLNFEKLWDLADSITFAFKKQKMLDDQIQGDQCLRWYTYNLRRSIYEWKVGYSEVLKQYYVAAWGIDTNQHTPGRLTSLRNVEYSSSIVANSKTKDKEGECEAVQLKYYNCDLQCGSAKNGKIPKKKILEERF